MAKNNENKSKDEYDPFVAETVFSNASQIFGTHVKPLEDVKDEVLIVLDANALLVPYRIGKNSLEQIGETYRELVSQNRLVIPAQVAREFANNRPNRLKEVYQQLNQKKGHISKLKYGGYSLLESLPEYQELVQLEQEIQDTLKKHRKAIDKTLERIRSWRWNDPVSTIYSELFDKHVVFEPEINESEFLEKLEFSQTHKIPPGYKDSNKPDNGLGDLLIWHTILQVGQAQKRSVIFVTGEEKADWWHRSEGRILYPRYELVDEFKNKSEGQSFYITSFSGFLDLFGADEDTVEEVREEEKTIRDEYISEVEELFRYISQAKQENTKQEHFEQYLKHTKRDAHLTRKQVYKMNEGVEAVAELVSLLSGEYEYFNVYKKLYEQLGATNHEQIPTSRFDEIVDLLQSWWCELSGESKPPF